MSRLNKICSYANKKKYIPKQKIDLRNVGSTIVSGFKKINFKSLPVLIVVIALCVGVTAGSIAYLTDRDSVTNTFTPSSVTCSVEEIITDNVKSSVQIKNTGDIDAYIRVAVIANEVDEKGDIIGAADVSDKLCGENWKLINGYYYYIKPVAPDNTTGELLKSEIPLKDIQVTVVADAIQSRGDTDDGNIPAVQDAWKDVTVDSATGYLESVSDKN